jgi:hypothetical protein
MAMQSARGAGLATLDKNKIVLNNSAGTSPLTGQIYTTSTKIGDPTVDGLLSGAGGVAGMNLHCGRIIIGNPGFPMESAAAALVSTTAFTASFAMQHSGTYNVGYKVSAYSDTAVSNGVTDTLTLDNVVNIEPGNTVILQGTGTDSAKTNTMTVKGGGVDPVAKTVQFTAAIATNDYSHRINITSVAYLTSATTVTAGTKQVITASGTTGLSVGGLAALIDLTGNAATAGFLTANVPDVVVIEGISSTSVTLTPNSAHTGTYAIVPFTATTSATAVTYLGMPQTITLTSGTNFATGLSAVYVWGGTGIGATFSIWDSKTAAAATNDHLIFSRAVSPLDDPYTLDVPSINGLWVSVGPGQIATVTFS